jgi:repressor LexA
MPSGRCIGRFVGYASPRSGQQILERLDRKGWISYSNGTITLRAIPSDDVGEKTIEVPLLGAVACGLPTLAEQQPEALIEVSTKLAPPGHPHFLLRARGNSMNRSGINDGDLVLVRQQPTAEQGDRVVVLLNDEATIKHFRRQGNVVALLPSSTEKSFKPIFVASDVLIQGVVVATLPRNLWSVNSTDTKLTTAEAS